MQLTELADIQNEIDTRGVALDQVGICGLYYPFQIRQQAGGVQVVTARVDLSVSLHETQRGLHLSRLVQSLDTRRDSALNLQEMVDLLAEVRVAQTRSIDDRADIRVSFKYFLDKAAPMTRLRALVPYDCGFEVLLNGGGEKSVFVTVPIAIVCPCSLEISDVGAHNQRAEVTIQAWQSLDDSRILWFEDLISLAESCASSEVHAILKRADEKFVTEKMFQAPRFVEDIVRDIVARLRGDYPQTKYHVRCESFESIHAHNAFAEVQGGTW